DITAKVIAKFFRFGVKEAGEDRRVKRPGVARAERKIMQYDGDVVSVRRLPDERVVEGAGGTLQVLKHHNSHPGAGRRLQGRSVSSECGHRQSGKSKRHSGPQRDLHRFTPCFKCFFACAGALFRAAGFAGGISAWAFLSISSTIWLSWPRSFNSSTTGWETPPLVITQIVGVCSTPMRWPSRKSAFTLSASLPSGSLAAGIGTLCSSPNFCTHFGRFSRVICLWLA